MKPSKNNLYSRTVRSGNRTYYIDAKVDESGKRAVQITESILCGDGYIKRHKVMMFESTADDFAEAFLDVTKWLVDN